MIYQNLWIVFSIFLLFYIRTNAKAVPGNKEIAGADVLGLHAGIRTNLFSKKGPLAKLDNEIESGANALAGSLSNGFNELSNNLQSLEESITLPSQVIGVNLGAGLNTSLFGVNTEINEKNAPEKLVGVDFLGLKAAIDTNLFSKNGPIAEAEAGLKALANNANSLLNSINAGTNSIMEEINKNLNINSTSSSNVLNEIAKSLGLNLPTISRSASLDVKPSYLEIQANSHPSKSVEKIPVIKLPDLSEGITLPNLILNFKSEEPTSAEGALNLNLPEINGELSGNLKLEVVTIPNLLPNIQADEDTSNLIFPNIFENLKFPNLLEGVTLPNLLPKIESEESVTSNSSPPYLEVTEIINVPKSDQQNLPQEIKKTLDVTGKILEETKNLKLPDLGEIEKIVAPILPKNISIILEEFPKDLSLPKLVNGLESSIKDLSNNKELQETLAVAGVIGVVVLILVIAPELAVVLPQLAIAAPEISATLPELSLALPEISAALESTSTINLPNLMEDVSAILNLPNLSENVKISLDKVLKSLNLPNISLNGIVKLGNLTLTSLANSGELNLPPKGNCLQNLIKLFTTLLNGLTTENTANCKQT